jgi:5-methyltetrahydropteroyltriglutamate--homocysteine methyltransferase
MKTEPIGSIPRPPFLLHAIRQFESGQISREQRESSYASALKDAIAR